MDNHGTGENLSPAGSDETHRGPVYDQGFWEGRAAEFSKYAASTGYPERFIALMDIDPDWTVLDMACGGGTLAIPLAERVKAVDAVDFASNMLDIVRYRCRKKGISNVRTIQGRWEDDWDNLGIGTYDVAIASRSLHGDDPSVLIRKLDRAARKQVYISAAVGDGPFDRRLFEAMGRELKIMPDYMHYYRILYEMGIRASVTFVVENHRNSWASHEAALEGQRWMFHEMTVEEEQKVTAYLKDHLVPVNGRWEMPYSRNCYWAIMWWSKE